MTASPAAALTTPAPVTAIAWKRPDGTWRLSEDTWGDFAAPSLGEVYAKASAYLAGHGDGRVLAVRLHRPGSPEDWQVVERLGYGYEEDA